MAGAKEVGADESGCDKICGDADDALKPCGEYFSGAGDVLSGVFGGSWLFHDAGDVLFSGGGFWLHALAEALRAAAGDLFGAFGAAVLPGVF